MFSFTSKSTAMQQFKQLIPKSHLVFARYCSCERRKKTWYAPDMNKPCWFSSYNQSWDKLSEHVIFSGFHCKIQAVPQNATLCDFNASHFKLCHATIVWSSFSLTQWIDATSIAQAFIKAELCPHRGRRRRIWWRSILEPIETSQSVLLTLESLRKPLCSTVKSVMSCKWCLKQMSIPNSEPTRVCWTEGGTILAWQWSLFGWSSNDLGTKDCKIEIAAWWK
jgi:hypothetical protein